MGNGGKICGICGEDCSAKPRIKDPKGTYFCKSCYDEARAQRKAAAPPPPPADDFGFLDDLIDEVQPQATPAVDANDDAKGGCPSCGQPVDPLAVICMNCGFNLRTGTGVSTKVAKSRRLPSGTSLALLASPMGVGIGALVVLGGLFLFGLQGDGAALTFLLSYLAFGVVVGIWMLLAGFREGILHGLLTLFIPLYFLYVVYGLNENRYLKWLCGVYLLLIPAYALIVVKFGDAVGSSQFTY